MKHIRILENFLEDSFRNNASVATLRNYVNADDTGENTSKVIAAIDECLFTLKPTELQEIVDKNVKFHDPNSNAQLWLKQTAYLLRRFLEQKPKDDEQA